MPKYKKSLSEPVLVDPTTTVEKPKKVTVDEFLAGITKIEPIVIPGYPRLLF